MRDAFRSEKPDIALSTNPLRTSAVGSGDPREKSDLGGRNETRPKPHPDRTQAPPGIPPGLLWLKGPPQMRKQASWGPCVACSARWEVRGVRSASFAAILPGRAQRLPEGWWCGAGRYVY